MSPRRRSEDDSGADEPKKTEALYTLGQLAEAWGISIMTVRRYVQKGALRAVRLPSGHMRIPASAAAELKFNSPLPEPKSVSGVYFLQAEVLGLIKIGASNFVRTRLNGLRSSLPFETKLLGIIPCDEPFTLERDFHERFVALRVNGDWYRADPELLAAIADSCDAQR